MIDVLLFAALEANRLWYALPLIVSISLVYAATRHEQMKMIVSHALRTGTWIGGLLLIIIGVLWLVG